MSETLAKSKTTIQPSNARIIARNVLFGFGENIGLRVLNFIFGIVIIRTLGDSTFGQYSIVLAWTSLFSVAGDFGISQYFTREFARDPERAGLWFWDILVLRIILAILATIITVGGAILYNYDGDILLGITLYTVAYFLQAFYQPMTSILRGKERIDILSVFNVIGQIIFITLGGLFLFLGFSFISLVIISFINFPILIILSVWVIRRNHYSPPPFAIHMDEWWSLLKNGFPFALTQLSLSFAFDSDTVILSRYRSDEVVGWYATGYRLMLSFMVFFMPFHSAILPTLTRQHASDPDSISPWYYTSVRLIVLFSLPIVVGGTLLSHKIIPLLYGPEFTPVILAFAILVWYLPFRFYTSFAGQFANITKRESAAARIFLLEGIGNVALNILLIPPFGLVGAAFATILTDIAGAGLFYFLYRKALGPGLQARRIVRVLLSVILMGFVVNTLQDQHLLLTVGAGSLIYFVSVWIFSGLADNEKQTIRNLVCSLTNRLSTSSTQRNKMSAKKSP